MQIGTLNEGALHAQLKEWYRRPGDLLEQVAGGFVVDLVRGDLLVEIQTGGFAPLRRKPELFDTAELAQAAGIERRLAQQMTYCLRAMGVLDTAGKRSGAVVHRRVA